ncbi:MAG TPA: fumarylacetoacetate hydrolase family protein [bacterium]|nr:fumarylacetoacetate hydrolase family protein [bacterium]
MNYYDHALEAGMDIPNNPVIFIKGINSIIGLNDGIVLPEFSSSEVDYEGELVIVIGKSAKDISEDETSDFIFGYTCGNDITARDIQLRIDKQWSRSKSFDTFCPIGPCITTGIDPSDLEIVTRLNNNIVQKSKTSKMIFNCNKIVSYLSKHMTLLPKTIIMTGTPSGVGYFKLPKLFLKRDDIIEIEIEKIGRLKNHVI